MSNPDAFMAQVLSGQQLDGELQRNHAQYDELLRARKSDLQALCAESEVLKNHLDSNIPSPFAIRAEADAISADAAVSLPEKGNSMLRAKQVQIAYCLRHGQLPDAVKKSTAIAVMVLLIVVFGDALVNVSFFLNAHMVAGPLAALLVSFLISLTNVSACACAGFFIARYKDYGVNAKDSDSLAFVAIRTRAKWLFPRIRWRDGWISYNGWIDQVTSLTRKRQSLPVTLWRIADYARGHIFNHDRRLHLGAWLSQRKNRFWRLSRC